MEKTKKMSKSSIAIIVLSLLLVLSMVLTLTGAWFTDGDDDSAKADLTFGKVNIQVTEDSVAVTPAAETDSEKVVPGDSYELTGEVVTSNSTVDMYVVLTLNTEFKIGETTYTDLFKEEGAENSILTLEELSLTDNAGWVLQNVNGNHGATYVVYKVTVGAANAEFEGSLTISTDAGNIVYTDNGTAVVLNDVDTYTTVTAEISISLSVEAIQAGHLADADAALDALGHMGE